MHIAEEMFSFVSYDYIFGDDFFKDLNADILYFEFHLICNKFVDNSNGEQWGNVD